MIRATTISPLAAAALIAGLSALPAGCDSHHHGRRYRRAEVDFDSLEARLHRGHHEWRLSVKYRVEIEHGVPGRYDLVLQLMDDEYPLLDDRGRPVMLAIPLDRPRDVDDDDFEYSGRITDTLPEGLPVHPKRLRVQALIVDPRTDRVIKDKDTSVKCDWD